MDGMPAMIMTFRIVMIELYEMTKWLNFSIWYGRRHIIDGLALSYGIRRWKNSKMEVDFPLKTLLTCT